MKICKLVFFGDKKVGVSSITNFKESHLKDELYGDNQIFYNQVVTCYNDRNIEVFLIELPKHPMIRKYLKHFLNNVDVIVICFAVNDLASFKDLDKYMSLVDHKKHISILCGTKTDLNRVVSENMGIDMTKKLGCNVYVECSKYNLESIRQLFQIAITESSRDAYIRLDDHCFTQAWKSIKLFVYSIFKELAKIRLFK